MKIRLHITHTSGHSAIFEHTGPNVRLGRDPAGELTLEGDSSQGVSWNHARIELTPAGAFLSDLGSTNGTLLNGQRISTRSAIRLGDHLQLGHTGPKLKIVDLELSPGLGEKVSAPPRAGAPTIPSVEATAPILAAGQPGMTGVLRTMQRTQRTLLMGLMLLGACVLLLAVALWWKAGPSKKQPEAPVEETATTVDSRVARASQGAPVGDAAKSVPTLVATPANVPNGEHKEVGRYVLRDKEPPSVLLQRERDPDPWGRLRPDSPIRTGYHLVSLPGYRSKLYLQSGVHLVLWGNVPEFSAFPPVLESMVMLHDAPAEIDLEFTLERGRVHLSNYKSKGPATVRIRFHQELWDLVLPDNTSEAALELWGLYDPESPISKEAGEKAPVACVGLFIKGGALLETKTRAYHLPDLSQFEWARGIPASDQPRRLSQLPAWWTNRIDPKADPKTAEQLNEMLWALKELSAGLGQTDAALDGVLTQVRESIHPANRSLGALCLGALDAVAHLVDALEDRQYYQVRWAAIHALQVWISRSADFDRELYRTLVENKGYSKDNAAIIRRLLHSFSVAERADPKTYETLIAQLGHDKLAIRELACWHLTRLAPQLARDIRYDPANVEGRVKACEEWRKKLPPGTVPSPPKSPTGAGARRSQETSNKSTWLTRAARSSAITSVASGELSGEHHRVEGPGHDR